MVHVEHIDKNGKTTHRYFHPECHDKYLLIEIDMVEQAALDRTIKRIHGISGSVSPHLWTAIVDVRNGTIRKGSRVVANYKDGVPFSVIEQAWIDAEQAIMWAKSNVKFQGEDEKMAELKYAFAIVKNGIPLAYHRAKKHDSRQRAIERTETNEFAAPSDEDFVPMYKKRTDNDDISDWLDD
jgi:hypothetical protein